MYLNIILFNSKQNVNNTKYKDKAYENVVGQLLTVPMINKTPYAVSCRQNINSYLVWVFWGNGAFYCHVYCFIVIFEQ